MRKLSPFTFCVGVSSCLLAFALVTSPMNCANDSSLDSGTSLFGDVRIGAYDNGFSLFNNTAPYRGSIIELQGSGWVLHREGFDAPGIYYRFFAFKDGSTYWTLTISRLYAIGLAAILPVVWLVRRLLRALKMP
jgi:hypothetical protein